MIGKVGRRLGEGWGRFPITTLGCKYGGLGGGWGKVRGGWGNIETIEESLVDSYTGRHFYAKNGLLELVYEISIYIYIYYYIYTKYSIAISSPRYHAQMTSYEP